VTDPADRDVLEQLIAREPIFHRQEEHGTSRAALEAMTDVGFWEVGASGRRYSREFVIALLEQRYARGEPDVWSASEFHCRPLAPDLYLLTYTLLQDEVRVTRRSTIWRRWGADWQIVYHQGTLVEQA